MRANANGFGWFSWMRRRWWWSLVIASVSTAVAAPRSVTARDGGQDGSPAASSSPDAEPEAETPPAPSAPAPPTPPAKPQAFPGSHTVKRGDSLSKISRRYFHDPYRWPRIWSLNPEITNPHWIYPGQSVRLRGGTPAVPAAPAAAAPARPVAEAAPPAAPVPAEPPRRALPDTQEPSGLRQVGFVDEGELKSAGVINGSTEEKILLGSGDHAYVEFPVDKQPKGGSRFTVYQADLEHPIREPLSNNILGYLVHIYGDVVIDSTTDRTVANGRLVDLVAPVERGYLVGPHIHRLRTVRPKSNLADMTARVVASVEPNMLISNQMFVVLNRGSRHGVELGNRFLVLRQGDGIKRVMEDWEGTDHRYPPHAVAEIVAVDVQNETTVGWISRGTRELHIGDLADMRQGY